MRGHRGRFPSTMPHVSSTRPARSSPLRSPGRRCRTYPFTAAESMNVRCSKPGSQRVLSCHREPRTGRPSPAPKSAGPVSAETFAPHQRQSPQCQPTSTRRVTRRNLNSGNHPKSRNFSGKEEMAGDFAPPLEWPKGPKRARSQVIHDNAHPPAIASDDAFHAAVRSAGARKMGLFWHRFAEGQIGNGQIRSLSSVLHPICLLIDASP